MGIYSVSVIGTQKPSILAKFNGIALNLVEFVAFMFLYDLGGPGPLRTINIPIGILRFSAWDRQDHPKTTKNWILQYFLKNTKRNHNSVEIMLIQLNFVNSRLLVTSVAKTPIFPKGNKGFREGDPFTETSEIMGFCEFL